MAFEKPSYLEFYKFVCSDGVERTYARATNYFKQRLTKWKRNEEQRKRDQNTYKRTANDPIIFRRDQETPKENAEIFDDIPF